MPIPSMSVDLDEAESPESGQRTFPALCLVESPASLERPGSAEKGAAPLSSRACAHVLDLCVVQGFSLPVGKGFSALLVSLQMRATQLGEKAADSTFLDGFEYANGYLLGASFATLSAVYFVGLPLLFGRTFGLGLFGLKIQGEAGKPAGLTQILLRYLGCMINLAAFGLPCVLGLRKRDGRFLQDRLSGTWIARIKS